MDQVAWTRGQGCVDVADALSGGTATRIEGDLAEGCIRDRVDTLVTRKLTSFELVPVVVPSAVDLAAVGRITVAVGEGPHSPFAVAVAARLAVTMDVPARAVSVQAPDTDVGEALGRIDELIGHLDGIEAAVIEGSSVTALAEGLDDETLLVVGAPGGSWFQRQIYGPGRRLRVAAPAGILTVRTAPMRCFHRLDDPHDSMVGADMAVADARNLALPEVASVADHGELVGLVRRSAFADADPQAPVRSIMELPVALAATDPVSEVDEVHEFFGDAPIPVVDDEHMLLGVVRP